MEYGTNWQCFDLMEAKGVLHLNPLYHVSIHLLIVLCYHKIFLCGRQLRQSCEEWEDLMPQKNTSQWVAKDASGQPSAAVLATGMLRIIGDFK